MTKDQPKIIELKIPCYPEYVGVVRLTLSGIASRMNFNYDQLEDLKIAVAEACTNAIQHAYRGNGNDAKILIRYIVFPKKLTIEVKDEGKGFDMKKVDKLTKDKERERGLGIILIKALVDESEFKISKDGTKVSMTKYLS